MKTWLCLTAGIFFLAISDLSAATLYVSPASMNPTPPYATWATAATNIQDAVDAAQQDAIVLVTNGVYAGGVTISKALTLLGLNAAQSTVIDGAGASRCLFITNGVKVSGFTLTNGWADNGGGLWCNSTNAWLTNCVIAGNSATQNGGGAYGATLYNCRVTGNSATNGYGGGSFASMLYNCTVTGNSAASAGGASGGIAYNSILYFNTAPNGANYLGVYYLLYCCTTPLPDYGDGSFTNAPAFVDYAVGNLHLQPTSPCINAGNNSYAHGETDLDGNPRISEGSVDVGAYEFQPTGPPSISLQPLSQTLYSGTNVSLKAAAYGSPPLSWQWWFNDTAILSATNSSLALPSVATNQAGNYFVVVTNTLGSSTSQVAVLTVLTAAPSVTLVQPINQTVQVGSNVILIVSVTGSLPLSWQWNFNGTAILGATNSSLSLPSVTTNQAGTYSVVVTNSFGSVTSQVAVLTVLGLPPGFAPVITLQPVSQTVSPGDTVAFTAQASGSMPMVWQWLFNKTPISGGNSSNLTLNAVTINQAGIYSVKVTNAFGTVISADATLSVRQSATAYVWQNSPGPTPPYTNWATAAHTIQDAVDASAAGDLILVTNGVYASGGRSPFDNGTLVSRVAVNQRLALRSVNGPQFTVIDGGGTNQCVSMTNAVSLFGFTLTNGISISGGGANTYYPGSGLLTNCVLTGNRAYLGGGGVSSCTLYNCTLTGNWAETNGDAAINSTLYNCTLSGNSGNASYGTGAAVYGCTLYNCAVTSNSLAGADSCTLYNCTVAGNQRGGVSYSALYNSIAYYNKPYQWAPENPSYLGGTLNYCSTIPMPSAGAGNITNEPLFVDSANGDFHLQLSSPCVNAGNNIYVSTTTDLDGNPRILGGRVDVGAYESAYEPPPPIVVTRYVSQNSVNPAPPYTNWDTAARNIQVAVNAANAGDEIVVSNGVYATGGRTVGTSALTNRVVLAKPLTLRSLNGPDATIIQGYQVPGTTNGDAAIRCVYMTSNTILSGFTFTKGATLQLPPGGFGGDSDLSGGGIYCDSWGSSVATGCKLVGNSASQWGGGAFYCALDNCLVVTNSSDNYAGGTAFSYLTSCTVAFNSATHAGGLFGSTYNCVVYYNKASSGYDWEQNYGPDKGISLLSSCTTPVPPFSEWENIGAPPLFIDPAKGDFHLQPTSPCVNAGNNRLVGDNDLDGNPRIAGGTVDIGAYENQQPLSLISQAWLQQYGLATDGSDDFVDTDGDGMNNWQEWVCGTDPTDPRSVLRLLSVTPSNTNAIVSWQSGASPNYFLLRSAGLGSFSLVASNLVGQGGTNIYNDTNAIGSGPFYYRVGVKTP